MSLKLADIQTEAQFTRAVIDYASLQGYLVHHCRSVRKPDGSYATPIQGHPGFPDIVAAGHGKIIFMELKVGSNKPTPAQVEWLDALERVEEVATQWEGPDPIQVHCFYPRDWDTIEKVLAR